MDEFFCPPAAVPRPRRSVAARSIGEVSVPHGQSPDRSAELIRRWERRSRLAGLPVDELWRTRSVMDVAHALVDDDGLPVAVASLGAARAGWFTEPELTLDLTAALGAADSLHIRRAESDGLLETALVAYRRECDAARVAGLVVDALTSLDTEEAFLVHLWDLVQESCEVHMVVSVPPAVDDAGGRLSRPILLGRALARCSGLGATAILDAGVVVGCARTKRDAEAASDRLGAVAPGVRLASHPYPRGETTTITFGRWYTDAVNASTN